MSLRTRPTSWAEEEYRRLNDVQAGKERQMAKKHGDFSIGSDVWPGTSKLLEEMGELQQVLGKLLGTGGEVKHWDGSNLRERLVEEIADVKAALAFFQEACLGPSEDEEINRRTEAKRMRFWEWHAARTKP